MAKISISRAVAEVSAYAGISTYAITMTTPELGLAITILGGVIGIIVWAVRLEGRLNTQEEVLKQRLNTQDVILNHLHEGIEELKKARK